MCGRPHTSSSQTETTRCSVRCLTTRIHKLLSSPSLAVCSKVKLGCRHLAACVIQGAFNTTHPQGPCAFQASQTNSCKCCIPSLHMPSEKRGKKGLISTTVPEQHKYFVTAESLNRKTHNSLKHHTSTCATTQRGTSVAQLLCKPTLSNPFALCFYFLFSHMPLDHGEIRFPHRELRVLSAPTVLDSCAYLSVIEAGL